MAHERRRQNTLVLFNQSSMLRDAAGGWKRVWINIFTGTPVIWLVKKLRKYSQNMLYSLVHFLFLFSPNVYLCNSKFRIVVWFKISMAMHDWIRISVDDYSRENLTFRGCHHYHGGDDYRVGSWIQDHSSNLFVTECYMQITKPLKVSVSMHYIIGWSTKMIPV